MNRIKCLLCNDIIESKSQHDFKRCSCGVCFVDGGSGAGSRVGFKRAEDVFLLSTNDDVKNQRLTEENIKQCTKN